MRLFLRMGCLWGCDFLGAAGSAALRAQPLVFLEFLELAHTLGRAALAGQLQTGRIGFDVEGPSILSTRTLWPDRLST